MSLPDVKLQDGWPLVDHGNISTQCSQKGCVLKAYHAGAHDDDFLREPTQLGKVVCVHDAMIVKRNFRVVSGSRAASNEDFCSSYAKSFAAVMNFHCMRV